ncbi:MAG: EamA family transporter RarD [Pseudomonadota bacterium]|nr:EamA family transporter RarD [Pseudomonadota bacterium]
MNARPAEQPQDRASRGLWFGVAAYGLWGVLPIYFKAIDQVGAIDIVAHRVLWSVPFLFLLLFVFGGMADFKRVIRKPRTIGLLAVTAVLIGINWLLYVYAVVSGHILAGSLGYYLNPLVNVLMGRLFLKERLSWLQWAAVAIAALGISGLAFQAVGQLWISLTLAVTFATYGLLRKIAPVDATSGLTVETSLILPLALAWLVWGIAAGRPMFGTGGFEMTMLLLAGVATTVPLVLFTAAARRLRYSTLGMLQFIAPTLQFICAVFLYGEAFTRWHAIAFGSIWLALALYVIALVRNAKAAAPPMPPE